MIASCRAYGAALAPFDIAVTCIACGYVNTEQLRQLSTPDSHARHISGYKGL